MGFHVGGAGAGADSSKLVFDEEFADEGLTEAEGDVSRFAMWSGEVMDVVKHTS